MIDTSVDTALLNTCCKNTIIDHLGIEVTHIGPTELSATMPIDHRTVQSIGFLHGGASATLAETVASLGGYLCVDRSIEFVMGTDLSCRHLRPVRSGLITATASPFHLGRSTHLWHVVICDEEGQRVCFASITLQVMDIHSKSETLDLLRKSGIAPLLP